MDQVDDAVSQVAGEIRSEVLAAVLAQLARDEHLGVPVTHGQLHVRVGLVVAKQDVEARLALFDQVVFKRECFVLVRDLDVIDVDGFAHQRARLGVHLIFFQQVAGDAVAKVLRLAYVDDLAVGVLVKVDTGLAGQRPNFLLGGPSKPRTGNYSLVRATGKNLPNGALCRDQAHCSGTCKPLV